MTILGAALVTLHGLPARAAQPLPGGSPAGLCLDAVSAAERRHQTPPGLLATMARLESGRSASATAAMPGLQPWPWTIDADGQSLFFDSKQQAVEWARAAMARGVTYIDVGCLQVDLPMHPSAFASLDDAFDPAMNADYAARFLRDLHAGPAGGNWFLAVGYYHSRTPDLAAAYREAVAAVAAGRPIPTTAGAGQSRLAVIRVMLAGGGSVPIHVGRQPARIRHTRSACEIARILGPYLRSPAKAANCQPQGSAGVSAAAGAGKLDGTRGGVSSPVITSAQPLPVINTMPPLGAQPTAIQ